VFLLHLVRIVYCYIMQVPNIRSSCVQCVLVNIKRKIFLLCLVNLISHNSILQAVVKIGTHLFCVIV